MGGNQIQSSPGARRWSEAAPFRFLKVLGYDPCANPTAVAPRKEKARWPNFVAIAAGRPGAANRHRLSGGLSRRSQRANQTATW